MNFINKTLGNFTDEICIKYKNNEAIIYPSENSRYTYKEFQEIYTKLAKGLIAVGVKKNDHIAVLSLNSPLWLALQIAGSKIGCVMVCLNTGYTSNELAYVLEHSQTSLILLTSGYKKNSFIGCLQELCPELGTSQPCELKSKRLPLLKTAVMLDNSIHNGTMTILNLMELGINIDDSELEKIEREVDPLEVSNIQYTSGTTGNPKAVMSTQFSILNNALVSGKQLGFTEYDRMLLCLPFFHVIGYVLSAVSGLFCGAALVIADRFETKTVLQYMEDERCTVFNGVPTMFSLLLEHDNLGDYDLYNLKKGFIAGSCCSRELMLEIMYNLGVAEICNVYGQTEAIAITQTCISDSLEHRLCTIGKPIEGVEAKIIDPITGQNVPPNEKGELCVKTCYLMKGYYKDKESTDKTVDSDGWLHTGDIAEINDEGYISIVGRIKDMIIRGGENISPAEIENCLRTFPGIKDAAVIAVPDELLGEEIFAFIIKDNSKEFAKEDVKTFLSQNLSRYKIPKYLEFINSFPTTASGKVRKFELRKLAVSEFLSENQYRIPIKTAQSS